MKSKFAALALLLTIAVVLSSAPLLASGSDAADTVSFDRYYYGQLTEDQKTVYDAMCALSPDAEIKGDSGGYYIELTVSGWAEVYGIGDTGSSGKLNAILTDDAAKAWEATKLDMPSSSNWAFWTWTLNDIKPAVAVENIVTAGSGPYCITQFDVRIAVDDAFSSGFSDAVSAVNEAVSAVSIGGSSVEDKVKNINKTLTGSTYIYLDGDSDRLSDHTFARTVYAIASSNVSDGKYYLTSEAFAAVFKALCDANGVPCAQVYGTYGDNEVSSWNIVSIDGKSYAVDCGQNSKTGSSETWLASGIYSSNSDGDAFSKLHRAFAFGSASGYSYDFESESLSIDGYEWHEDDGLVEILAEYAPWILIGVICVILAIVLVLMAKKGD